MIRGPRYLDRFRCLGPACEDNCCAGWQAVDVDSASFTRYQEATDPELGPLLRTWVVRNEDPWAGPEEYGLIEVPARGQCPFFGVDRLCAIQGKLGEDWLPAGCDTFPRQAMAVDGVVEVAGRLSCPEMARVALLEPSATDLLELSPDRRLLERAPYWVETPWSELPADDPRREYHALRARCVAILRSSESIERRILTLGRELGGGDNPNDAAQDGRSPAVLLQRVEVWGRMAGVPERYRRCLDRVRTGLDSGRWALGVARFGQYAAERPWVFENLLVSQVLVSNFPFHPTRSFLEEWAVLACRYGLIKLHLVGAAAASDALTDELVVETVQAFDKYADSEDYWRRTLGLLREAGLLSLSGVASLLASRGGAINPNRTVPLP